MQKALEDINGLPDGYIYSDSVDPSSERYISEEELGALYYDAKQRPDELDTVESYCLRISKTPEINEIHIVKTKYRSDNDMILRMFQRRAELLTSPQINPRESAFISNTAEECKFFAKGNFVFLVAGSNITPTVEALEELI